MYSVRENKQLSRRIIDNSKGEIKGISGTNFLIMRDKEIIK